ncbi:MAG: redox-regulated ATPase YchF [Acidimicrobiales bacterium]|jgi:GTP-binding protein YchF
MDRLGLVGLPNSGKSALFNALTGGHALVASHPFSTTETEVGVAHVPDPRLEALAKMSESRKVVMATFEVVDIAGVQRSSEHAGDGLGTKFIAGIREVDALAYVLRSFEDESAPGDSDPIEALGVLELELVLSDAGTLENQINKKRRAFAPVEPALAAALEVAPKALGELHAGTPLYRSGLAASETDALRPLFLLTNKPVLAIVNIGEAELGSSEEIVAQVSGELGGDAEVLAVSVQLEAEAALLDAAERAELLEGLGLGEGALVRVARAAYDILGRDTFLTTGDKESRAWTFRRGAKAPECAGVIHSDLQRGFIKADVIDWKELLEIGSFAAARAKGKVRLEGKDYVVQDGDVLEIRFNV